MAVDLNALWDFGNAPASEARLRSAAESSDDHVERPVLLTQVACALGLQGRYDEAHTALDGVEAEGLDGLRLDALHMLALLPAAA